MSKGTIFIIACICIALLIIGDFIRDHYRFRIKYKEAKSNNDVHEQRMAI